MSFGIISFIKRATGGAVPVADDQPLPVSVGPISAGNSSVQTAATGSNFASLASQACKQVEFQNNTGADIEVRQDGAGVATPVFDGTYYTFAGLTNANQLSVRRVDQSNTQVTATYRWGA